MPGIKCQKLFTSTTLCQHIRNIHVTGIRPKWLVSAVPLRYCSTDGAHGWHLGDSTLAYSVDMWSVQGCGVSRVYPRLVFLFPPWLCPHQPSGYLAGGYVDLSGQQFHQLTFMHFCLALVRISTFVALIENHARSKVFLLYVQITLIRKFPLPPFIRDPFLILNERAVEMQYMKAVEIQYIC